MIRNGRAIKSNLKDIFSKVGGGVLTSGMLLSPFIVPALISYYAFLPSAKKSIELNDESKVQAQQGRMTAEAACTEQEKMSRKLQNYFDREAVAAVSNEKLAAKNANFVITKEECLNLVQQRAQAHSMQKP